MIQNLQQVNDQITRLNDLIYQEVANSYLSKHLHLSIINQDKSFFLYSLLTKYNPKNLESVYIAVMLVDLALETHEKISIDNKMEEEVVKERQLTVLAGDYYSSLYYLTLAKLNEIDLVETIANAIQKINEQKMNQYFQKYSNVEEYLTQKAIIQSTLLSSVANTYNNSLWADFSKTFFLLSSFSDMDKQNITENISEPTLLKNLVSMKKQVEEMMRKDEQLKNLFYSRVEEISQNLNLLEKVTEEGI